MASNAKRSRRIKQRIDPAERLARQIVPAAQTGRGEFVLRDVANHSDSDQRDMQSLQRNKTVRRLTKLEKLHAAKAITKEQLAVCEWYRDAHTLGFETLGITADYGRAGGGSSDPMTHLAKHKAQHHARRDYQEARAAIDGRLVFLFERVVLDGHSIGRLANSFRLAAEQVRRHLEHIGIVA